MAMKDWFRRKPGPETVGKSQGGSRLIKYRESCLLALIAENERTA